MVSIAIKVWEPYVAYAKDSDIIHNHNVSTYQIQKIATKQILVLDVDVGMGPWSYWWDI